MMLTGDHESSAQRVAKAVCIDEVHFSLKPEDKLNKVKAVSREGGTYTCDICLSKVNHMINHGFKFFVYYLSMLLYSFSL